ncbi:MAG: class I tRNA ligase family protein [Chloracidobacterium sp.]|nr:class I tRNA ligase family protein [Chloracidobacterium sp.]
MELAKAYDPKTAEESHYKRWEEGGFFAPEINQDPDAVKYSIVIPPPNVTGSLHMGHALQHTIMDVLTRRKRMQGFRTLWLPGTDQAGISVQRKVVEQLKKDEHKKPLDIGREESCAVVGFGKNNTATPSPNRCAAKVRRLIGRGTASRWTKAFPPQFAVFSFRFLRRETSIAACVSSTGARRTRRSSPISRSKKNRERTANLHTSGTR